MENCPICLEELFDDIHVTDCGHHFHWQCVQDWYDKVKRLDCPYCRRMPDFDKEMVLRMELLFIKLASCRCVRDFSIENLKIATQHIPDYSYYLSAINCILSDDLMAKATVEHCLESLISRCFLRKEGDLYFYCA